MLWRRFRSAFLPPPRIEVSLPSFPFPNSPSLPSLSSEECGGISTTVVSGGLLLLLVLLLLFLFTAFPTVVELVKEGASTPWIGPHSSPSSIPLCWTRLSSSFRECVDADARRLRGFPAGETAAGSLAPRKAALLGVISFASACALWWCVSWTPRRAETRCRIFDSAEADANAAAFADGFPSEVAGTIVAL